MTRYARSGNSQRHKKMPGDATSWGEFSQEGKFKSKGIHRKPKAQETTDQQMSRRPKLKKKFKREPVDSSEVAADLSSTSLNDNSNDEHKPQRIKVEKEMKRNDKTKGNRKLQEESAYPSNGVADFERSNKPIFLSKKQKKKSKNENQHATDTNACTDLKQNASSEECLQHNSSISYQSSTFQKDRKLHEAKSPKKQKKFFKRNLKNDKAGVVCGSNSKKFNKLAKTKQQGGKNRDKSNYQSRKKYPSSNTMEVDYQPEDDAASRPVEKETQEDNLQESSNFNHAAQTKEKFVKGKQLVHMQHARKTHRLKYDSLQSQVSAWKRRLQEKGMSDEVIEEIIQKRKEKMNMRRKMESEKRLKKKGTAAKSLKEIEEIKERKKLRRKIRKFKNATCFNCREVGHSVAFCPKASAKQETGICFKCGSPEHTSSACTKKVEGYPFAKCFICKTTGHISRDCPQNEHGIYPKGGKCDLCGNINHLKKDCPTLQQQKDDDEEMVTLHMIGEGRSIDAEVEENIKTAQSMKKRGPKVVRF